MKPLRLLGYGHSADLDSGEVGALTLLGAEAVNAWEAARYFPETTVS
jgi:hypothetical protein